MNRMDAALETVQGAIADYQALIAADPSADSARRGLAEALLALGILQHLKTRPARAAASYDQGLVILDQLAALHPEDLELRDLLGRTLTNRGNMAIELNQMDDADRSFQRARALYEGLVRDQPNVSRFQFDLGHAQQSIAWWLSLV